MLEEEYFGPKIGALTFYETSWSQFHQNCSSSSSSTRDADCTGQRMYTGAHVACRMAASFPELLRSKSLVELGCGTGIVGIMSILFGQARTCLLTDGATSTLEIAARNVLRLVPDKVSDLAVYHLEWGNTSHIETAIHRHNGGRAFDLVIGCELMYYRTDVAQLVDTVLRLCSLRGLFLHCHLFRRAGQAQQLVDILSEHNWTTLEVPCERFIAPEELSHHADWYSMRCMLSGPSDRLKDISQADSRWIPFVAEPALATDSELFGGLFSAPDSSA